MQRRFENVVRHSLAARAKCDPIQIDHEEGHELEPEQVEPIDQRIDGLP